MEAAQTNSLGVGQRLTVSIEKVAHGGHFIARHEGQVIFIRHVIPGELVEIEITSATSNFFRADLVKVLESSPDRVEAPCSYSHPGGCGGCDFQHISIERQRALKADVIVEQFSRIAKKEVTVLVEEVGDPLGWRTRISSATNDDGELGFYSSRSHAVIPVADCLIAAEAVEFSQLATRKWPKKSRVEIQVSSTGERSIAIAPANPTSKSSRGTKARLTQGPDFLTENIDGHALKVGYSSFWQSHDLAPEVLCQEIRKYVESGDYVLDLYGGVGLFTAAVLDLVGPEGHVDLIESSPSATSDARRNFEEMPNVEIHVGEVAKMLGKLSRADLVILDPPREGSGRAVLQTVVGFNPRALLYVACDPAALARDCRYLEELGWQMSNLRAFDLFPMTHHIECVALFETSQNPKINVS